MSDDIHVGRTPKNVLSSSVVEAAAWRTCMRVHVCVCIFQREEYVHLSTRIL